MAILWQVFFGVILGYKIMPQHTVHTRVVSIIGGIYMSHFKKEEKKIWAKEGQRLFKGLMPPGQVNTTFAILQVIKVFILGELPPSISGEKSTNLGIWHYFPFFDQSWPLPHWHFFRKFEKKKKKHCFTSILTAFRLKNCVTMFHAWNTKNGLTFVLHHV